MIFSAHFHTLLQHLPPVERIEAFAKIGFKAFELWGWWDEDIDEIAATAKKHKLQIAALCTPFVSLTDATKRDEYLTSFAKTVKLCKQLDVNVIISQVGDALPKCSRKVQTHSIIEGLMKCADLLDPTDINLCIEPLNLIYDHEGYFLSRSDHASQIIEAVNHPNISMLFDVYHQQITEGNVINNINTYHPLIGHYHIADNPGRNEPGTGEINYANVIKAIKETGYIGYIGLEFAPKVKQQQKMLADLLKQFGQ